MTEGGIFLKMVQFSVPLILSSVLQLLFNAADIVVVGQFAGDNAMAAVGSTSSLINLLVNLFVGLSVGCNVVCSNFYGAMQDDNVSKTVHTAVLLSFISGFILTCGGILFSRQVLLLMSSPEEVLPLATKYLQIYFGGITATMIYNFGSAVLRSKGDTKRPLYILLAAGLINLILNLVFVIVFKMSVAGVGFATVLSQCFSAFWVLKVLAGETDAFKLDFKKLCIHKYILIKILKVGIPAGIQGAIFSLSNVVIQSTVNSFGAVCVAGNSASHSIEGFIYTSMNGISQGSLTFVSQNMGAGKIDRIKKVVVVNLLSVTVVGFVLGLTAVLLRNQLFSIFSDSPDVIAKAGERLFIIGISYCTCGIMDVMANSIRGMGYSFFPMVITMVGACGVRILYLFTVFRIERIHTFQNIFISYPLSWVITFMALLICFVLCINRTEIKTGK